MIDALKVFIKKCDFIRHIDRKFMCKITNNCLENEHNNRPKCKKIFKYKKNLNEKIKKYCKEFIYNSKKCNKCDKLFYNSSSAKRHEKKM